MKKSLIFISLLSLLILSCNTTKKSKATLPVEKAKLDDTEWILEAMRKKEIRYDEENEKISLKFNLESGMLSGNSGCNQYLGKFSVQNDQISIIDPIGSTRKICFEGLMTTENSYLNTLKSATKYQISDGKLQLFQNEIVILTFYQKITVE